MKRRQTVWIMLTPIVAVLLSVSTVLAGQQDVDRAVIDALVSARIDMMGTTNKEIAASKFTAIATSFPDSQYADDALLLAGRCLLSAKRYEDAIRVFRQIVDRYPKAALVVNGSWFSNMAEITGGTSKGIPEQLRKPSPETTADAQEAVKVYESYMEEYPELTADWARYEMARIYHRYLHDNTKAREIIQAFQGNPDEEATRIKQDRIFQERMDALIMDRLRQQYSPILRTEPEHRLSARVKALREALGVAAPPTTPQPQETEIQRVANTRVDEFFRVLAPRLSQKKEPKPREADSSRSDKAEALRKSIATLADPLATPGERNRAVVILGHIADPEAVPVLLKFIASPEAPVAQNAIRALGEIKDTRAVQPLLKLVEDPPQLEEEDIQVLQARAIGALGAIGDASALDGLKRVATRNELSGSLREKAKSAVERIERQELRPPTETSTRSQ